MTIAVVAAVLLLGLGVVSAQQSAGGARSFDSSAVAPGGTLVVTIAVTIDYGSVGAVTETLPEGFAFVSSSHPEDQVRVDGNTLRFTFIGPGTTGFEYTVTAPVVEGLYQFTGTLRDDDKGDHSIGGASEVAVAASAPGATAEPTPTPAEPAASPTAGPTSSPTATATPGLTEGPTPSPTPAPTPGSPTDPMLPPTATAAATPTATATQAPASAGTPAPTATPTRMPTPTTAARMPTPTPVPTVPVVTPVSEGGMPAWVILVAVVAVVLVLIAGVGMFATSRQR